MIVRVHLQCKEFAQALGVAKRLAEKQPDNPLSHNLIGSAREDLGDSVAAAFAYEKALSVDPGLVAAVHNLTRLDLTAGDKARTIERFNEALKRTPHQHAVLNRLAVLAFDGGDGARGVELLEESRRHNPTDPTSRSLIVRHCLILILPSVLDILIQRLCMLPDFLPPPAVEIMAAEVRGRLDKTYYCDNTHNAYLRDDDESLPESSVSRTCAWVPKSMKCSSPISAQVLGFVVSASARIGIRVPMSTFMSRPPPASWMILDSETDFPVLRIVGSASTPGCATHRLQN